MGLLSLPEQGRITDELFTTMSPSYLHLENGLVFEGISPKWQQSSLDGEVVFTTGMTGYDLSLTDPSYCGQILVFTFPLIGNYGVPSSDTWESEKIWASGVVINDLCENWSHGKSERSFLQWLKEQNIPVISGVDTRALTKVLREAGTMLGTISFSSECRLSFKNPNTTALAPLVSIHQPHCYGKGTKRVIAVDCGMKSNIMRHLTRHSCEIVRVPCDYDYSKEDFDGVFLSNGPGDPSLCLKTIEILKKAMKKERPIFGICLGAQLLALAAGAKTYKLRYGHRGHNQPCIELATNRCFITSQNHGYAIDANTLPNGWHVSFKNLNDDTVEGIAHASLPFFAVQFHPEAAPGPTDTEYLFQQFIQKL